MSDPSTRLLVKATVESLQAEVRELRGRLAVAEQERDEARQVLRHIQGGKVKVVTDPSMPLGRIEVRQKGVVVGTILFDPAKDGDE